MFNAYQDWVEMALARGHRRIEMGLTAYGPKMGLEARRRAGNARQSGVLTMYSILLQLFFAPKAERHPDAAAFTFLGDDGQRGLRRKRSAGTPRGAPAGSKPVHHPVCPRGPPLRRRALQHIKGVRRRLRLPLRAHPECGTPDHRGPGRTGPGRAGSGWPGVRLLAAPWLGRDSVRRRMPEWKNSQRSSREHLRPHPEGDD